MDTQLPAQSEPPTLNFIIGWIDIDHRHLVFPLLLEEQPDLPAALQRACELIDLGKPFVAINRPDGSMIETDALKEHCAGTALIAK